MTPYESLLLELIPVRLSPPPKADRGPTALWLEEEAWDRDDVAVLAEKRTAS